MTASTVDRNTKNYDERVRAYPVAAATTIYNGVAVATNADGNAVLLTDSSAVKFVGIALEGVVNTTAAGYGTAGDLGVRVHTRGVHAMVSAGLALTDQLADLYWADNQTVQTTPTNQYAGKLARYTSATEALLDIGPALGVSPVADDVDPELIDVAANAVIAAGDGVAMDIGGHLIEMSDGTAVSFWGIALTAVDNTGGADGDLSVWVARSGLHQLTGAALGAADVGKEVYQVTDNTTVTTTPGNILVGHLEKVDGATVAYVRIKPLPIVGQRVDRQFHLSAMYSGAIGHTGVKAFEDREFLKKYVVLSGFADCQVAPGGAYTCTLTLDDGVTSFAVVITGSDTHGENKTAALSSPMLITDTDLDMIDNNASGASETVKADFLCEAL